MTITIPNCIALEQVDSIFKGHGIRGRILYVVVDFSLIFDRWRPQQIAALLCYNYHAVFPSHSPVSPNLPFHLVYFKPLPHTPVLGPAQTCEASSALERYQPYALSSHQIEDLRASEFTKLEGIILKNEIRSFKASGCKRILFR